MAQIYKIELSKLQDLGQAKIEQRWVFVRLEMNLLSLDQSKKKL